MVSAEDEYNGYRIPKGSIVVGNVWSVHTTMLIASHSSSAVSRAILHDEKQFPDAMAFKPERYLMPDGQLDPTMHNAELAAFGFGRRICAGRHMSVDSVWIAVASILSTFKLTNALDNQGNVVTPSGEFSAGFIMCVRYSPASGIGVELGFV